MKTKIRTFQGICTLGFIALVNVNAVADNKTSNLDIVTATTEKVIIESANADVDFLMSAQALTAKESDAQVEKFATKQIQLNENVTAKNKFADLVDLQTSSESDTQIAKYATLQVELQKNRNRK